MWLWFAIVVLITDFIIAIPTNYGVSQAVVESLKTTAQIHLEKPVKLLETFSINAHGHAISRVEGISQLNFQNKAEGPSYRERYPLTSTEPNNRYVANTRNRNFNRQDTGSNVNNSPIYNRGPETTRSPNHQQFQNLDLKYNENPKSQQQNFQGQNAEYETDKTEEKQDRFPLQTTPRPFSNQPATTSSYYPGKVYFGTSYSTQQNLSQNRKPENSNDQYNSNRQIEENTTTQLDRQSFANNQQSSVNNQRNTNYQNYLANKEQNQQSSDQEKYNNNNSNLQNYNFNQNSRATAKPNQQFVQSSNYQGSTQNSQGSIQNYQGSVQNNQGSIQSNPGLFQNNQGRPAGNEQSSNYFGNNNQNNRNNQENSSYENLKRQKEQTTYENQNNNQKTFEKEQVGTYFPISEPISTYSTTLEPPFVHPDQKYQIDIKYPTFNFNNEELTTRAPLRRPQDFSD